MASKTQIAKKALSHIGDRFDIQSITEASTEAEQVNLVYEDAVRELLREHPWKFAKTYVSPAYLSGTPPGGWTYMFTYPTDCIKIQKVTNPLGDNEPPVLYDKARKSDGTVVLLCEEETPEFVYTAFIDDPQQYDQLFIQALEYRIASKVAIALTGEAQLMQAMFNLSRSHVSIAQAEDANEGIEDIKPESDWIRARA